MSPSTPTQNARLEQPDMVTDPGLSKLHPGFHDGRAPIGATELMHVLRAHVQTLLEGLRRDPELASQDRDRSAPTSTSARQ